MALGIIFGVVAGYTAVFDTAAPEDEAAENTAQAKKDIEALQGTWRVVSSQVGDEKASATQKPKAIDITLSVAKGETMAGIYALENDSLRICFSEPGQNRPTEFTAQGKPGLRTLLVFQRSQVKEEAGKKELRALEGTWAAVSYTGDGEGNIFGEGGYTPSAEALKTGKLILKYNETLQLDPKEWSREEFHEGKIVIQSSFTGYGVDSTIQPKAIDFILRDVDGNEILYRGIYELKGGSLQVCRTVKPNGPRPAKFEAEKCSEKVLAVWRRVNP
jgi:uncharacterized protein (TIGR03067 family)